MVPVSRQAQSRRLVGLNAHLLSLTQDYRGAGINGHIYQLLRHLPATRLPLHYTAFLHETGFSAAPVPGEPATTRVADARARLDVRRSRWNTRRPWRRILWEQSALAVLSRRLDLLHGLAYAVPLLAACPTVITVHDLSFMRFPDAFRPFNRAYLTFITRSATRRAARVIAVSESTRQDVVRFCGVPADRVVVIPNGVSGAFHPVRPGEAAAFRQRQRLPEHFVLFLGTLEPRKNLLGLLEAYALWLERRPQPARRHPGRAKLVIAGGKGWYYQEIFERTRALGLAGEVIYPGYIPADELPSWYQAADAFVYPSLFEGFGLPVLEAMASGTPVITSNVSSLPEVAGDAALLVDPHDVAGLADAIDRILGDRALAAGLRDAGLARAASFSWPRAAEATAALYWQTLGGVA